MDLFTANQLMWTAFIVGNSAPLLFIILLKTKKISRETGKKGKSLYSSIRLAITGLDKGPEMNLVLPLINRNEIIRRLQAYK